MSPCLHLQSALSPNLNQITVIPRAGGLNRPPGLWFAPPPGSHCSGFSNDNRERITGNCTTLIIRRCIRAVCSIVFKIRIPWPPSGCIYACQRQNWDPSKPFDLATIPDAWTPPPQSASGYAGRSASHYTNAPMLMSLQQSYEAAPASAAPRTQPADPYSAYQQAAGRGQSYSHSSYSSQPAHAPSDPYGRSTASAQSSYAAPSATPATGYYIVSNGQRYPTSQQPISSMASQGQQ
jgi:hypothetical protein